MSDAKFPTLVTAEAVQAVLAESSAGTYIARLSAAEPAILAFVSSRAWVRGEAIGEAALRATGLAWAAFTREFGPRMPTILPVDLEIARKDAALAPERQPHVWSAVTGELGAAADDPELRDILGAGVMALDRSVFQMPRPPPSWMPGPIARALVYLRKYFNPQRDDAIGVPRRLPFRIWMVALFSFLSVYLFTFTVVHVEADVRRCQLALQDPLHQLIPFDAWWWIVSIDMYTVLTFAVVAVMFFYAAVVGDHRPAVRFGVAIALVGVLRAITILLVPLCRYGSPEGSSYFSTTPMLNLGFIEIPWRMFATNDLLFSGHVAEVVLFLRVTRAWPKALRFILWSYCFAQIYALLATRGHYTVDILLAFPCTYFADRLAVQLLAYLSKHRELRAA